MPVTVKDNQLQQFPRNNLPRLQRVRNLHFCARSLKQTSVKIKIRRPIFMSVYNRGRIYNYQDDIYD